MIKKLEQAKELYLTNKYSLTQLGKILKIDRGNLSDFFKKEGILIENLQNKASIDETVFDVIDTEAKAYWLGFMYADGYISLKTNHLELSLQLSDTSHLEKFKSFLKWTKNIATDSYRCRCCLANKHIHKSLVALGCTPRKSLTLVFPTFEQVPELLIHHFMRGYFDGDGCTRFTYGSYKTKGAYTVIELLGTLEFVTKFNELLPIKSTTFKKDKRHLGNTYQLATYGEKALINLDFLYRDATIFLERKYNKYKQGKIAFLEWKLLKETEQNRKNPPII